MAVLWRFEEVPLPSDQSHATNRLAQFVAGSQWETIPSDVQREGVRGLLNFVGCALGGAQDEAMRIAVKVLTPFFGPPQGIVIGRGDRPDALSAAFLNAISANVLEYDDTHLGTVMHPAAPIAPGLRTGWAASGVRPRSAARVYSRCRDFVPRRARRDADALPPRLAHHRDLRDFRSSGCLRPPARARCARFIRELNPPRPH